MYSLVNRGMLPASVDITPAFQDGVPCVTQVCGQCVLASVFLRLLSFHNAMRPCLVYVLLFSVLAVYRYLV